MTTERLPAAPDAEKYILGVVLAFPEVADEVFRKLRSADFVDQAHAVLFDRMAKQHAAGGIDAKLIAAELREHKEFHEVSVAGLLLEFGDQVVTSVHVPREAAKILEARRKRQLFEIADNARTAAINGQAPTDVLGMLRADLWEFEREVASTDEPRYRLITAAELDASTYDQEFLIDDILVAGDFAIIGGPEKSLKTSLMLDMFVALSNGGHFLGTFPVRRRCKCVMFSGESGLPNLQDIARRICRRAGYELARLDNLILSPDLPQLDNAMDLAEFERVLAEVQPDVGGLDPMFLCMGDVDADAGNLFVMGKLLRKFAALCHQYSVTPIIAHHTTTMPLGTIPKLSNLAWSGFKQAAGQWILLNRRMEYEPGSGQHELIMTTGGRAGHNLMRAIDIKEGTRESLEGRYWHVDVHRIDEARDAAEQRRTEAKASESQRQLDDDRMAICQLLVKHPGGRSKTFIRDHCGVSGRRWPAVFAAMYQAGELIECEVTIGNKKSPQTGYRLSE
jgi:hypothetical protein